MLKDRGIRRGIEVFVKNPVSPDDPQRRGRVVNVYPHPSNWLVVKLDDGDIVQVEEQYVTTMFEVNRHGGEL
jgi:hypothetical protein